jgi:hypothetical protein
MFVLVVTQTETDCANSSIVDKWMRKILEVPPGVAVWFVCRVGVSDADENGAAGGPAGAFLGAIGFGVTLSFSRN